MRIQNAEEHNGAQQNLTKTKPNRLQDKEVQETIGNINRWNDTDLVLDNREETR